jgi:hypothetical protein
MLHGVCITKSSSCKLTICFNSTPSYYVISCSHRNEVLSSVKSYWVQTFRNRAWMELHLKQSQGTWGLSWGQAATSRAVATHSLRNILFSLFPRPQKVIGSLLKVHSLRMTLLRNFITRHVFPVSIKHVFTVTKDALGARTEGRFLLRSRCWYRLLLGKCLIYSWATLNLRKRDRKWDI